MWFNDSWTCWSQQKGNQHKEDPEEMSLVRLESKSHGTSTWKMGDITDRLELRFTRRKESW
jgi:hypothetical protein